MRKTKEEKTEESLNALRWLYIELGRCPKVSEYEKVCTENKILQRRNVEKFLGINYNEICMKYLGVANQFQKSKEELIDDLNMMKDSLGRIPMAVDLKDFPTSNVKQYQRRFGMTFNNIIKSLDWAIAGHEYTQKTDEELLSDYYNLYIKLGRIPIYDDVKREIGMASNPTYMSKFGSWQNIWKLLEIESEAEIMKLTLGYGFTSVDLNGELCRSHKEMIITNLLIENNILYIKEKPYKDVLIYDKSRRRLDWYLPELNICVEYFGLFNKSQLQKDSRIGIYSRKTIQKIKDCHKENMRLISIFPKDFENNSELVNKKFEHKGIILKQAI